MGWENVNCNTFEQLKEFIYNAFSTLKGDFMDFNYTFSESNHMHWEMNRGFAYNGMKMISVHKYYEYGVIYRISCWLDALGINYTIEPEIDKCLLNSHEKYSGNFILDL